MFDFTKEVQNLRAAQAWEGQIRKSGRKVPDLSPEHPQEEEVGLRAQAPLSDKVWGPRE